MTVVFVADEGVADSGFNATYQAVSLLDSELLLENLLLFTVIKLLKMHFLTTAELHFQPVSSCSTSPVPFCFSSSPVHLLHLKGLVLPTSSPAAQVSVCSNSGCVTDGTTALMEQMNMAVTTPPILPSVSPLYFHP